MIYKGGTVDARRQDSCSLGEYNVEKESEDAKLEYWEM